MAERGILFSAPMVRALLDGRKTQTRRLAKVVPPGANTVLFTWPPDSPLRKGIAIRPPQHAVGDRLWVRENFWPWTGSESGKTTIYAADGEWIDWGSGWRDTPKGLKVLTPMTPSIHMHRWRSRLDLTVTEVRVQRLQEISEADAEAEGIVRMSDIEHGVLGLSESWGEHHSFGAAYRALWNLLHTKPGERWADNPWVVAYTFTVERRSPHAPE